VANENGTASTTGAAPAPQVIKSAKIIDHAHLKTEDM
jgi:hypothetical protein